MAIQMKFGRAHGMHAGANGQHREKAGQGATEFLHQGDFHHLEHQPQAIFILCFQDDFLIEFLSSRKTPLFYHASLGKIGGC